MFVKSWKTLAILVIVSALVNEFSADTVSANRWFSRKPRQNQVVSPQIVNNIESDNVNNNDMIDGERVDHHNQKPNRHNGAVHMVSPQQTYGYYPPTSQYQPQHVMMRPQYNGPNVHPSSYRPHMQQGLVGGQNVFNLDHCVAPPCYGGLYDPSTGRYY